MANESSLRSYRDFDAYNRDAHAADLEPRRGGGDPLAELARIMGQDQGYADLLKSVARTRDDLPAVDEQHHDEAAAGELDIPAMDLRGAEPPAAEAEVDWDDLEAELQTYQQAEHADTHDAYATDQDGVGDLRGSYRDWDGRDEATVDLERLLADEFHKAPEAHAPASEETGRSRLGFGAAALGVVAAGGAAALAWKSRSSRQAASGEAAPQAYPPSRGHAPADAYATYEPGYADEAAPPRRRRAGMTAVAAVLGLAVLGGGGVLAYRAVTGGASTGGEPRIVRANPEPVRVAVQQAQEPKPVIDRVPGGDRVVSREERPVSQREQAAQVQAPPVPSRVIPLVPAPAQAVPVGMVTDPGQAPVRSVNAVPVAAPALASVPQPAPRAGEEPRRVRTVQVGPDGSILQPATAPATRPAPVAVAPAQPLSVVPGAAPASTPSPALAAAETRSAPTPASRPVQTVRVARAEPAQEPARPAAAPRTPATATPLDLGPQRTATVRTATTGSGSTFVQISSHQSDAEARSAFASAQRRFPLLQGQSLNIRTAEIAGRGTWHRLRVGPFSREEAQGFCERLKTAGGSCVLN
jgi:hypothetical protein